MVTWEMGGYVIKWSIVSHNYIIFKRKKIPTSDVMKFPFHLRDNVQCTLLANLTKQARSECVPGQPAVKV